ncbi:Universal stress protein family [Labilithrix luteola]|uniref:Universal stress protein family n=1 Tax=Labilithrix luteola TaxID=1391654 RepID=A0A0K1PPK7_9BACT|nr:universal stress protein [Labilithrix luteola]AKU95475.1 Universal stress protein family [Labilithrix luteola]
MKRILVAVDGSRESEIVVAKAVEVARDVGGRLSLLHVIEPHQASLVNDAAFDESRRCLERLEASMPPSFRGGCEVRFGLAAKTICEAAASKSVDVIVIGAHEHGVVERALGTTAAEVVNHADRTVLVVRCQPEVQERPSANDFERAGDILRRDHRRLEQVYEGLASAYRRGDWNEVIEEWNHFEPALMAHMEREEREVFPSFRLVAPEEAKALLDEHEQLRRLLATLGVHIEIHAFPMADAEDLIERLHQHEVREATALYPFVDLSFDALAFGARDERSSP